MSSSNYSDSSCLTRNNFMPVQQLSEKVPNHRRKSTGNYNLTSAHIINWSFVLSSMLISMKSFLAILIFCLFQTCYCQKPLAADDLYTFCGSGRSRGDITSCKGYCPDSNTKCSPETGVCSCSSTKTISNASANYNCKPAASRTRCSNACKTFAAIESFRRGESRICTSKSDNRRMCFCMPRIK